MFEKYLSNGTKNMKKCLFCQFFIPKSKFFTDARKCCTDMRLCVCAFQELCIKFQLNIMSFRFLMLTPLKEKMLHRGIAHHHSVLTSTLLTWTLLNKVKQHKVVSLS